jgi:hypothetical protein
MNLSAKELRRAAAIQERIETLTKQFNTIIQTEPLRKRSSKPIQKRRRRRMSAAVRAKMAAAARARWRKAKAQGKSRL